MESIDLLHKQLDEALKENKQLKEQLDYQIKKHNQWKMLAMTFHDSLWKMIDTYMKPMS